MFKRLLSPLAPRAKHCAAIVAALTCVVVLAPAAAQAEYNGHYYLGCTYSWGTPCYAPYQHAETVVSVDPDNAYYDFKGIPTSNGYPQPKLDGVERNVCSAMFSGPGAQSYPWVCANGIAGIFPKQWGNPATGTGYAYYNIALYQGTNY